MAVGKHKTVAMKNGKLILLNRNDSEDLNFVREAYGFEAEERGWFREKDRLFAFSDVLETFQAEQLLSQPEPANILDVPLPAVPDGELSEELLSMPDGAVVKWVRHPSLLPEKTRKHWCDHQLFLEVEGKDPAYKAYVSVHRFAVVPGHDGNPRFFGPGGIRWVDYPDEASAIADVLDMSLAVAMKIEVVKTPCAGSKISVFADKTRKGPVLQSLFRVFNRMGLFVTAADLGLSTAELQEYALPVAPASPLPLGVFQDGLPSSLVTFKGVCQGLHAMAATLEGSPELGDITVSIQGIGEVGSGVADYLIGQGTRVIIAEVSEKSITRFKRKHPAAIESGQARILEDPDMIYDTPADIFCPCALRDILGETSLKRFVRAGVKMIGGPGNNLFRDQATGPWLFQAAGIPVVPYEGIGAGGVTGVAQAIMVGILGKCPFDVDDKVMRIRAYVEKIIRWSTAYDLPAQVISDRILFRGVQKRTLFGQDQVNALMERLGAAFKTGDDAREKAVVEECTLAGFFSGEGKYPEGGWKYF